jgi:hypothetical protein
MMRSTSGARLHRLGGKHKQISAYPTIREPTRSLSRERRFRTAGALVRRAAGLQIFNPFQCGFLREMPVRANITLAFAHGA